MGDSEPKPTATLTWSNSNVVRLKLWKANGVVDWNKECEITADKRHIRDGMRVYDADGDAIDDARFNGIRQGYSIQYCFKVPVLTPPSPPPTKGNLKITILSDHGTVTSTHLLVEKTIPRTLEEFWAIIPGAKGVDETALEHGRASVLKKTEKWEKLTAGILDESCLKKDDGIYQYQVQRFRTPDNSPTQPQWMNPSILSKSNSSLEKRIQWLFSDNPFQGDAIPDVHVDTTMLNIRDWLNNETEKYADAHAIGTLFAMPGSGKTKSVLEAAKRANTKHKRIRICDVEYDELKRCDKFVNSRVKKIQNDISTSNTDDSNKTISIHFDEVQTLLDEEDGEKVLKKLASVCAALGNQNKRLKFFFTGTNINASKPIDLGSELKAVPFYLDGSFPKDFVRSLYKDHIEEIVNEEMEGFLERCHHNRRFTAFFLKNLWDEKHNRNDQKKSVSDHYEAALESAQQPIASRMANHACPAACRIFRILLQAINDEKRPLSATGGQGTSSVIAITVDTSTFASDLHYVLGGGLNVHNQLVTRNDKTTVHVILPEGCVFEILMQIMGRAVQPSTYNNMLSFLRTSRVKEFNFGWFMEALVVHDLKCVSSEFEDWLRCGRRHAKIMEAEVVNEPKLWECNPKASSDKVIWWVRDEMNSHQDRWIDIGYRQDNGEVVIVECKSGVTEVPAARTKFFEKAIDLATKHSGIQWIAVYLCSSEPGDDEKPENTTKNLQMMMKILVLPKHSEMAKTLRAAKGKGLEQQESLVDRLESGGIQTDRVRMYAGGSHSLVSTPTCGAKRRRTDPFCT
ncbi:expressed unknown protein [Seminavis robusta]|uniref:Uncharacterized protein n=1 Tax=Seminavis robusta TaxID=568900 RepID=A0A9N8DD11_9STRA|nr:expressed unknown protein [Seminavis robusta]|eukprot:Sro63_g035980.1 n/a (798) ;mRNA; f:104479-106872